MHVDFRYGRRFLRLEQGEVFLSVAKDAASPFLVDTPAGRVRVTGTEFNVRVVAGSRLEVTLLEGEVPSALDPPPGCRFSTRCPYAIDVCRSAYPELRAVGDAEAVACHRVEIASDGRIRTPWGVETTLGERSGARAPSRATAPAL